MYFKKLQLKVWETVTHSLTAVEAGLKMDASPPLLPVVHRELENEQPGRSSENAVNSLAWVQVSRGNKKSSTQDVNKSLSRKVLLVSNLRLRRARWRVSSSLSGVWLQSNKQRLLWVTPPLRVQDHRGRGLQVWLKEVEEGMKLTFPQNALDWKHRKLTKGQAGWVGLADSLPCPLLAPSSLWLLYGPAVLDLRYTDT